jgi:hypothetical protein
VVLCVSPMLLAGGLLVSACSTQAFDLLDWPEHMGDTFAEVKPFGAPSGDVCVAPISRGPWQGSLSTRLALSTSCPGHYLFTVLTGFSSRQPHA